MRVKKNFEQKAKKYFNKTEAFAAHFTVLAVLVLLENICFVVAVNI